MVESCSFEMTPYTIAKQSKANNNSKNLNYTNQDFSSLKSRAIQYVKEQFPNDFNDFIESSLGIMLLEVHAFTCDTLSFKTDQLAGEVYIDTVSELENAFRLAKLLGYNPIPPIPCRALFSATINTTLSTDLVIPGGLQVQAYSNNQSITYELYLADSNNEPLLDDDIIIPAGNTVNTSIIGLEGETHSDNFTGNGTINQIYQTSFTSVIYDSVRVDVGGVRWQQVDYFTDSNPRNEYRLEFDSDYRAYVIFGNGKAGQSPTSGVNVLLTYRVGGGVNGAIISGAIDTFKQYPVPGFNFDIAVSFRNYTRGEYGYDGDTIDDIRSKLPAYIKMQDRIVSDTDFKTFADQFTTPYNGQIGKSAIALRNYGCASNVVDVYILAKDGTFGLQLANDQLKSQLYDAISEKKMMGVSVCVRDGVVVGVDVNVDLTLDKFYRKFKEELEVRVRRRIDEFFSLTNWDYGKSLKSTDLVKMLSDIHEIESFDITFTTDDPDNSGIIVNTKYYEIIRYTDVVVNFIFE